MFEHQGGVMHWDGPLNKSGPNLKSRKPASNSGLESLCKTAILETYMIIFVTSDALLCCMLQPSQMRRHVSVVSVHLQQHAYLKLPRFILFYSPNHIVSKPTKLK